MPNENLNAKFMNLKDVFFFIQFEVFVIISSLFMP